MGWTADQDILQVWLMLRQGAKSSPKPALVGWWRLHSALLKCLLALEHCSQETQQGRLPVKESWARMLLCTRYLAARSATWAKVPGLHPVQAPEKWSAPILCMSPSHFQELGDFWNIYCRKVVDFEYLSKFMVHIWCHQKIVVVLHQHSSWYLEHIFHYKSGFWQTYFAVDLQTLFRSPPSVSKAFRAFLSVVCNA